jgi:anti-anti-sigma factor
MNQLASVEHEHDDGVTIVAVRGEIDVSNGDDVQSAILDAVTLTTTCVLLDLTDVVYFDSVGVRLAFEVEHRLTRQGIAFAIIRPPTSYIRKVLELCGAEHVLSMFDDRNGALSSRD